MTVVNTSRIDCGRYKILNEITIKLSTVNNETAERLKIYQVPVPTEFGYRSNTFIQAYGKALGDKSYSLLLGMDVISNMVESINIKKRSAITK